MALKRTQIYRVVVHTRSTEFEYIFVTWPTVDNIKTIITQLINELKRMTRREVDEQFANNAWDRVAQLAEALDILRLVTEEPDSLPFSIPIILANFEIGRIDIIADEAWEAT